MKLMKFTFSAPLQSWGEDARWDLRTTTTMPTKSAVIGFVGCCLGISRNSSDELANLNDALHMAVRADRAGRIMTDFQTVQASSGRFLSAEGKPRSGGNTIITSKQYLQEACFTVFLWGEEEVLERCYEGMLHPKWTTYLGRKNCVPSLPVLPQWVEAETPESAVASFTDDERKRCDPEVHVQVEIAYSTEIKSGERRSFRRDSLICADKNEYDTRWIKSFVLRSGGESSCS